MDMMLLALNPATGTQLPIPLLIISGVVLLGCIVAGIVTKTIKNKKGGKNKKR